MMPMLPQLLLSVFLGSLGQVMLKVGAGRLGGLPLAPATLLADLLRVAKVPEIVFGIVLFSASFLLWVKVLTGTELSYAYPFASLGYVNVLLLSWLLLGETMTVNKLAGIAIIAAGIIVLYK